MIEKVLTLSTEHMPESEPEFSGLRHSTHRYGYIVFVYPGAWRGVARSVPDVGERREGYSLTEVFAEALRAAPWLAGKAIGWLIHERRTRFLIALSGPGG